MFRALPCPGYSLGDARVPHISGTRVYPCPTYHKPYKFIGFGDIHGPNPYKFIGFCCAVSGLSLAVDGMAPGLPPPPGPCCPAPAGRNGVWGIAGGPGGRHPVPGPPGGPGGRQPVPSAVILFRICSARACLYSSGCGWWRANKNNNKNKTAFASLLFVFDCCPLGFSGPGPAFTPWMCLKCF